MTLTNSGNIKRVVGIFSVASAVIKNVTKPVTCISIACVLFVVCCHGRNAFTSHLSDFGTFDILLSSYWLTSMQFVCE